ncbi:MAG: DNA-protecting protein DprA [Candidatus Magasanikbacteria bacterium]|jgi:DNA processing protein|nr:DNA-protecting protein DprA [Candidatus Magasanikbacteria bacterium]
MKPCIYFAHAPAASAAKWRRFCDAFTPDMISTVSAARLKSVWKQPYVEQFISWRSTFSVDAAQALLDRHDIHAYCPHDDAFPSAFLQLTDPPVALFYKGTRLQTDTKHIAVIGSRAMSQYGKRATQELIETLAASDICIVSGLALGVDGAAHEAALRCGVPTVAILPGSVDPPGITPKRHSSLAERILRQGGTLVSEHPPGAIIFAGSFPKRNRLIAALCDSLIIIEAAKKSGTLITAEQALDLGKQVFALPHNIFNITGMGVNALLEQGAIPIISLEQVAFQLGITPNVQLPQTIPSQHTPILTALADWKTIDELTPVCTLHTSELLAALMELELLLLIEKDGLRYRCKSHVLASLGAT